jgi:hypothetical protein
MLFKLAWFLDLVRVINIRNAIVEAQNKRIEELEREQR